MSDVQEAVSVANALLTGTAILTVQVFPIALPLLALCVAPLALAALALALVAAPIVVPVLLIRSLLRRRAHRSDAG